MKMFFTFALLLLITTAVQAASATASIGPGIAIKDSVSTNPTANVETTQLNLSMKNTKGEVMMQQTVTASSAAVEIKLPQLPAGLYLITVKSEAKAQTQKFVIR